MSGSSIPGPIRDDNPCLDCHKPKRHHGCHGKCKDYEKWKAEKERVNRNRREYMRERDLGWRKKR